MSAVLSPATIKLAAESQLFATIEFNGQHRIALQPLAREVTWDPVNAIGFPTRVLVVTAAGEEVDFWDVRGTDMGRVWFRPLDYITVVFDVPGAGQGQQL